MKVLLIALTLTLPTFAEDPLAVELLSEKKVIAPGETFEVGLRLTPPDKAHTYWHHPGVVGLATSIQWDLPPGFRAGGIQWPMPEVVKMAHYTAQGYEGETLLMVAITPPESLADEAVQLTARASWMCCGEQCSPASNVPFSITLPVADESVPDEKSGRLFEKYHEQVPQPMPLWAIELTRERKTITLTLRSRDSEKTRPVSDLGHLRFFTSDGQVDSNEPQHVVIGPGEILTLTLSASDLAVKQPEITGVIVAEKSWTRAAGPRGMTVAASQ